jgi:flavorubredoxin
MKAVEVKPGIYWVGAKDFLVRDFHGYRTQRGSTYNSFLIVDEKVTLIDTVKAPFTDEMLARISSIIPLEKIDYVVANHAEMDHSGALPQLMKKIPHATLVTSPNGEATLKKHFDMRDWKIQTVRTGQSISLGKRSLHFVQVPFVHWPDSMVTWCPEEKILFSNDAFGQHIAPNALFDDETPRCVVLEEAAKYYANIVLPFANQVDKAIEAVRPLNPDIICPSHGVIWRSRVPEILGEYTKWCKGVNDGSALIVYDSMWESTTKMAETIRGFFEAKGIPVRFCSLKSDHISDVMTSVLTAKYIAIGTPVLNENMMPTMAGFLTYMRGLKPRNKIGLVFGSYGWNFRLHKEIEDSLKALEWKMPVAAQSIKYVPTAEELSVLESSLENMLTFDCSLI